MSSIQYSETHECMFRIGNFGQSLETDQKFSFLHHTLWEVLSLQTMLDLESWASGSIPTRGNILFLFFLFSFSKESDANIDIIAKFV